MVNLIWGVVNFIIGYTLVFGVGRFKFGFTLGAYMLVLGAIVVAVGFALSFGHMRER